MTTLELWHEIMKQGNADRLDEVLAPDCVFLSPIVHSPQQGRDLTRLYLLAAFNVFPATGGAEAVPSGKKPETKFKYVREVVGEKDAILEFTTEMDGILVNGVDMITWNDDGKIIEFKVMIRPLKAIQKVHAQMGAMLQSMKPA